MHFTIKNGKESTMAQLGCIQSRTPDTLREGVLFETDLREASNTFLTKGMNNEGCEI